MNENEERLTLLFANPLPLCFAPAETDDEVQALKLFDLSTPKKRTELAGLMYRAYANWYNDQLKELGRVSGDY